MPDRQFSPVRQEDLEGINDTDSSKHFDASQTTENSAFQNTSDSNGAGWGGMQSAFFAITSAQRETDQEESINEELSMMDVRELGLSFTIRKNLLVYNSEDATIKTAKNSNTEITFIISSKGIYIEFSPHLYINPKYIGAESYMWKSMYWSFSERKVTNFNYVAEDTWFRWDYDFGPVGSQEEEVKESINEYFTDIIKGTPLWKKDYNPFTDSNLESTIQKLKENYEQDDASETPVEPQPDVGLDDFKNITAISGEVQLTEGITEGFRKMNPLVDEYKKYKGKNKWEVRLPKGTIISLTVHFKNDELLETRKNISLENINPEAIKISRIDVRTSGIFIDKFRKPHGRYVPHTVVYDFSYYRGGEIKVTRAENLKNVLAIIEDIEEFNKAYKHTLGMLQATPEEKVKILRSTSMEDFDSEIVTSLTNVILGWLFTEAFDRIIPDIEDSIKSAINNEQVISPTLNSFLSSLVDFQRLLGEGNND